MCEKVGWQAAPAMRSRVREVIRELGLSQVNNIQDKTGRSENFSNSLIL
jgi:anti-sigma regulatory factor (Ser/Thr protein kinase)